MEGCQQREAFVEEPQRLEPLTRAQAVKIALRLGVETASWIEDLEPHLIIARGDLRFITSDHPVFRYNTYLEPASAWSSTTGSVQIGLQIFLPVSPTTTLLLYDREIYKVGNRESHVSIATANDVRMMNMFQAVAARQNVYFSNEKDEKEVGACIRTAAAYLGEKGIRTLEYPEQGNEGASSLIHQFHQTPNLHPRFSFSQIRYRPRMVPVDQRERKYRRDLPDPPGSLPPLPEGMGEKVWVRKTGN